MRHATAIRIAETGITSHKAGAPLAVNVRLGNPTISSSGTPPMTDSSIRITSGWLRGMGEIFRARRKYKSSPFL